MAKAAMSFGKAMQSLLPENPPTLESSQAYRTELAMMEFLNKKPILVSSAEISAFNCLNSSRWNSNCFSFM
ncbi:hypothetical protein D3C78_1069320 [compost metagenome]